MYWTLELASKLEDAPAETDRTPGIIFKIDAAFLNWESISVCDRFGLHLTRIM